MVANPLQSRRPRPLDIAHLQQAAGARRACCNGGSQTFFPRRAAVPREPRKPASRRPSLPLRADAAAPDACCLTMRIEAANGAARATEKDGYHVEDWQLQIGL